MLNLTRYVGQTIIIGDRLGIITVKEINGDKVTIGLDFPNDISIHREEIYNRIKREQDNKTR